MAMTKYIYLHTSTQDRYIHIFVIITYIRNIYMRSPMAKKDSLCIFFRFRW